MVLMVWGLRVQSPSASTETIHFEGHPLIIKWDLLTRAPLTMRAGNGAPLLKIKGISKRTRDQITMTGPLLVKKYKKFLGIEPDQLRLKAAERINGSWYVSYWQTVQGVIIYESSLGFSIDPQGKINSLGALLYPQVPFPEGFRISRDQALKIAVSQVPDFKKQDYILLAESVLLYPEKTSGAIKFFKVYAFNFFPRKALHPASVVGGYAVLVDTQSEGVIRTETLFKPLGCCVPENWVPPRPEELYKGMFGN
ncbi:MAG: hypothetical protein C0407_07975 [Desulfobacca sp.]|nr:hypothetical protein [Desulfobacca sp.]